MQEPVAIFKPRIGWRIGQMILALAMSISLCFLPLGIWFFCRALWTKIIVYPDRVVRTPFSWLGRRAILLKPSSRVGLGLIYATDDMTGDRSPEHWLVIETADQPLLWFSIEGYPAPRPIAVTTALQTGNPLCSVIEYGTLRPCFRFAEN